MLAGYAPDLSLGNGFIFDTGSVALAAAGNVRVTLTNPPGSGKRIHLYCFVTFNTASAMGTAVLYHSPTTGLPLGNTALESNLVFNVGDTNSSSVVTVAYDGNLLTPLSGGTKKSDFLLPSGRTAFDEAVYIIESGVTVGLNLYVGIAASLSLTGYFWEEDVSDIYRNVVASEKG